MSVQIRTNSPADHRITEYSPPRVLEASRSHGRPSQNRKILEKVFRSSRKCKSDDLKKTCEPWHSLLTTPHRDEHRASHYRRPVAEAVRP